MLRNFLPGSICRLPSTPRRRRTKASCSDFCLSRDDAAPNAPERVPSNYVPLQTFALDKSRQYQQQFADLYFLRLTKIRPAVEAAARAAWEDTVIGGEEVRQAERVLDVRQGALCWATGTIYVDMALKPNILDDVSKDVSSSFVALSSSL